MGKIVCFSNQKGGVAKTTTTCAMAYQLQKLGFKVLVVDMDPQGNLSFSVGANTEMSATIYDVLKGEIKTSFAIQHTPLLDVIPSNILLSGIELEFTGHGREFLLKNAFEPIKNMYDFILIDTPPALSILTVNAFTASDYIIIPMLSDIFSLQGITQLYDTIERVKSYCNPNLKISGILLTKFNSRTRLAKEVRGTAEMISEKFGIYLFKTSIRNSIAISESQITQRDMIESYPKNKAVNDYIAFVDEFLSRL